MTAAPEVSPGGAVEDVSDLVTVDSEWTDQGTLIRVVAPARAIKMMDITSVIEDLGITIVSYASERPPEGQPVVKGKPTSFRGRFYLTTYDGDCLDDAAVDEVIDRLLQALRMRLSKASSIKRIGSQGELARRSRRVSYSSYCEATPGPPSICSEPDSPLDAVPSPTLADVPRPSTAPAADRPQPISPTSSSALDCLPIPLPSLPSLPSNAAALAAPNSLNLLAYDHSQHFAGLSGEVSEASQISDVTQLQQQPQSAADDPDGDDGGWWGQITPFDTVDKVMSSPARCINKDADLGQAKALMNMYQISALLVDTGTDQPGFITKRDFFKHAFNKGLKRAKVRDIMTQPVIYVTVDTPIYEVSRVLEQRSVRRVLVYDPSKAIAGDYTSPYVGVVSDTDIFKCLGNPKMFSPIATLQGLTDPLPSTSTEFTYPLSATSGALSLGSLNQNAGAGHSSNISAGNTGSPGASVTSQDSGSGASREARELRTSSASGFEGSACTYQDRYRYAATLWELDFSELDLIKKIGEGSFGEVLLGNFRGTKVAVKRVRGFEQSDEDAPSPTVAPIFRQFFEREIEILATIRHPNVVNFIGACHTPPNVCLVTEYCARGSLDHLLHKSGMQLDLHRKVEFCLDIARGMSCLHAQRPIVIHRDLKTANLLVSARYEVKVADFGLSRIKDHTQLINSRAGLEGTVEYCAPEVLRGEPYTEKCDVWSYGIVLWELFHRQRPYADADVPIYILMMSLGNGSLKLPPVREELATSGLARLVESCLSWQASERPSFREILHFLEAEYKIVRGRAAAVPRSESATSIKGLPSGHSSGSEGLSQSTQPAPPMNYKSSGGMQAVQGTCAQLSSPPHHPGVHHQRVASTDSDVSTVAREISRLSLTSTNPDLAPQSPLPPQVPPGSAARRPAAQPALKPALSRSSKSRTARARSLPLPSHHVWFAEPAEQPDDDGSSTSDTLSTVFSECGAEQQCRAAPLADAATTGSADVVSPRSRTEERSLSTMSAPVASADGQQSKDASTFLAFEASYSAFQDPEHLGHAQAGSSSPFGSPLAQSLHPESFAAQLDFARQPLLQHVEAAGGPFAVAARTLASPFGAYNSVPFSPFAEASSTLPFADSTELALDADDIPNNVLCSPASAAPLTAECVTTSVTAASSSSPFEVPALSAPFAAPPASPCAAGSGCQVMTGELCASLVAMNSSLAQTSGSSAVSNPFAAMAQTPFSPFAAASRLEVMPEEGLSQSALSQPSYMPSPVTCVTSGSIDVHVNVDRSDESGPDSHAMTKGLEVQGSRSISLPGKDSAALPADILKVHPCLAPTASYAELLSGGFGSEMEASDHSGALTDDISTGTLHTVTWLQL